MDGLGTEGAMDGQCRRWALGGRFKDIHCEILSTLLQV